jgi:hypothetical protein
MEPTVWFDEWTKDWWVTVDDIDVGPFNTEEEAQMYFDMKVKG